MMEPPRAAVLDVGCFSAHLVVADQAPESLRRPVVSYKVRLRLDRALDPAGRIHSAGIDHICDAVTRARERLRQVRVSTFVPYATSCVRDAANADEVVDTVARHTGITLQRLSGEREARLSYTAARRWLGAGGPLAVLDIGGGTTELAFGHQSGPEFVRSLPYGARALTRAGLDNLDDLPERRADLVGRIADSIPAEVLAAFADSGAIGCSKVFQQLAKLVNAGGRPSGPLRLHRADLLRWIPRLAKLPPDRRGELPGISRHRARQSFAGAVVAEALMAATHHDVVDICPWSSKEGLLMDLLSTLPRRQDAPEGH